MAPSASAPRTPDPALRLATREPPGGTPVMFQQWRDLLFLHWEYSAQRIQATLPEGLFVDGYGGQAFLGVVPFLMRQVRPRFFPAVPVISNFLELNLRTYVHDRSGTPGVWFYSLDANQPLAVAIARRWFHLPYEHARMHSIRTPGGRIRFESKRTNPRSGAETCVFEYSPGAALPAPSPGSLEFFLIERYRLYALARDGLRRGAVVHEPYALCRAEVRVWSERLLVLNGFSPTRRPPDHTCVSPGVNVSVLPLERV